MKRPTTIVQIIGAVVDVEFPADSIPKVFDALVVDETGLTMEIQQQIDSSSLRFGWKNQCAASE